jgi:hypothetical protein
MKYYDEESYYASQEPETQPIEIEIGCGFCWDRRKKKNKELFFLDAANNMRVCNYCPSCGRKYSEEE